MEPSDLDFKKSLLPDELIFPVENITGTLNDYPNLRNSLQKLSNDTELNTSNRSELRIELLKMKSELLAKQQLYQAQFEELKKWMRESFEVESPQVLLDHQAKIREAELVLEEAEAQGNSKQHQRIRALNASNQAKKVDNTEISNSKSSSEQQPATVGRASKNLSRMNNGNSGTGTASTSSSIGGQGQKDLSSIKSKVPNQIPINVFWNYIEPFFKPIDEDDLKYLDDPSHVMDVAPFIIPPLGLHYEKIWFEQYGYVVPGGDNNKRIGSHSLSEFNSKNQVLLRDRLLSALIDKDANLSSIEDENYEDEDVLMQNEASLKSVSLDDRLRASLNELGFTDLTTSRDYQEDDEICVEMRSVQRQLREQIVLNQYRKKRLAEFIRSKLSSQEFYSLIGDLDKQIDGIFQKRIKNAKKKKTTTTAAKGTIDSTSSNEIPAEAVQSLENRRKLLETFAEIVPDRIESLCPTKLVDFDTEVEGQVIESAKRSSKWLPLPEIALKQPLTSCQPAFPNSRQ